MRCKSCTSHLWGHFALAMLLLLLLLLLSGVVAKSAFHSASIQLENVRAVERIAERVSNVDKRRNESPVLTKSEKSQKEAAEISSHTHTHTHRCVACCPLPLPPTAPPTVRVYNEKRHKNCQKKNERRKKEKTA